MAKSNFMPTSFQLFNYNIFFPICQEVFKIYFKKTKYNHFKDNKIGVDNCI
jgi:hypothetical protein